jgi:hypothetical protein
MAYRLASLISPASSIGNLKKGRLRMDVGAPTSVAEIVGRFSRVNVSRQGRIGGDGPRGLASADGSGPRCFCSTRK